MLLPVGLPCKVLVGAVHTGALAWCPGHEVTSLVTGTAWPWASNLEKGPHWPGPAGGWAGAGPGQPSPALGWRVLAQVLRQWISPARGRGASTCGCQLCPTLLGSSLPWELRSSVELLVQAKAGAGPGGAGWEPKKVGRAPWGPMQLQTSARAVGSCSGGPGPSSGGPGAYAFVSAARGPPGSAWRLHTTCFCPLGAQGIWGWGPVSPEAKPAWSPHPRDPGFWLSPNTRKEGGSSDHVGIACPLPEGPERLCWSLG